MFQIPQNFSNVFRVDGNRLIRSNLLDFQVKFGNDPKYEGFVLNSLLLFFVFQAKAKAAHDRLLRLNYNGQHATLVSQSSDDIYVWSSVLYPLNKLVCDFIKEICIVVLLLRKIFVFSVCLSYVFVSFFLCF